MSDEQLKELEKEVKRRRRVVGEWAAQLHDLAEECLPAAYEELPRIAQATYEACQAWAEAERMLKAAQGFPLTRPT